MRLALTIAARELGSMFRLPSGWVIAALYLFLAGVVFALTILVPGQPATLRPFFALSGWLLLPAVPAISMRLISEELRSGTIEPLMTSPVPDAAVVLGKYLGACGFFGVMLAPTLVFPFLLRRMAEPAPDLGPIVAGYMSLLAQGAFYLGIGIVASACTSNQTLAFLSTLFAILALLIGPRLAVDRVPELLRPLVRSLVLDERVDDFAKGIIDTSHLMFFAGGAAVCLTAALVVYQSRRWR